MLVTIDSPEIGSALANAFLPLANSTLSSQATTVPTAWWNYFCPGSSTTFSDCFASQGQPIAYQGDNADCGAVASLQTGYSGPVDSDRNPDLSCGFESAPMGFQNAPFDLQNAYTVNFAAYFDDGTAIGPSLLRFGLNQYLQAVSPGNSLDQILGNTPDGTEPNDVIVTVASQFNYASLPPGALTLAFPNLEHTAAGPNWLAEASSFLPSTPQDTNVLNSSVVNAAVLCALISSGGNPACVTPRSSPSDLQYEAPHTEAAQAESPKLHVFLAPGRLDVLAPPQNLKLAEENEISLQIHVRGLTQVETLQAQYSPSDMESRRIPNFPHGGWAMLTVLYHADGSAYIKVIPRLLGQIVLQVVARFPDGGETKTDASLRYNRQNVLRTS